MTDGEIQPATASPAETRPRRDLAAPIALLAILAIAAYLRFTGLNWDDYTHIHPDERFLTMVESGIAFPERMAEYFNTAT